MNNLTRRLFASCSAAGTTVLGLFAGTTGAAEAQLVWRASEWKLTGFHQLVRDPAQIKQVHDVVPIDDGTFLSGMKTSLNGLQFGFGIAKEQIKAVGFGLGQGLFVPEDDAGRIILDAAERNEAAALQLGRRAVRR